MLLLALVMCSGTANANHRGSDEQEPSNYDPRPYLILSGIRGEINFDEDTSDDRFEFIDQSRTGFEFGFGQKYSRHFALELSFANLGTYRFKDRRFPDGNNTERARLISLEASILSYLFISGDRNALFNTPAFSTPGIGVYVKTGLSRCDHNYEFASDQFCESYYFNLGLGMDLQLSPNVAIRLEAQSLINDFYAARLGFVFRGEFVDALLQIMSFAIYIGGSAHH